MPDSQSAASPRERFEKSKSSEDFLRWLNAYTNDGRRGDDELHALCSWAHSVIAELHLDNMGLRDALGEVIDAVSPYTNGGDE